VTGLDLPHRKAQESATLGPYNVILNYIHGRLPYT
jgi:hypothetical protein